jgi:uncharacterized membrane protein YbhN (UPF0104 family)
LIIGASFFFIAQTFNNHWQEVIELKITNWGWLILGLSLLFNLIAHIFSAWVWQWILALFQLKLPTLTVIIIYLITNIKKYIPGNIWHFYGRVNALQKEGYNLSIATITVVIEPLLMACSALLITIISASLGLIKSASSLNIFLIQILGLIIVLIIIHPLIINPILTKLTWSKIKDKEQITEIKLTKYPLLPLLGEAIFLLLRGIAFISALSALMPVKLSLIPQVLSVFSFAWLLGLIVPGAPGGMGVFEATVIASLDLSEFPQGVILAVVALFRLSSILAELLSAFWAWLLNGQFKLEKSKKT